VVSGCAGWREGGEAGGILFADEPEALAKQDELLARELVLSDRIADDCFRVTVAVYIRCQMLSVFHLAVLVLVLFFSQHIPVSQVFSPRS